MTTPATMSGQHFYRALAYAFKACPSDEGSSRLQHVAFVGNKVIGADGERWHVGLLAEDVDLPAMTVARGSISDLLMGLEYCRRMAKRTQGSFQVSINGEHLRIDYGAKQPLEHELAVLNLGKLPRQWQEPVAPDAPFLTLAASDIRCGHMQEAMKWHRSWEEDYGTFKLRGAGGNEPVRLDVTASGELVAIAFLLPVNHPPAELPGEPDLFTGEAGKEKSQSILDLDLSGDGRRDVGEDLDVDELDDEDGDEPGEDAPKKKKARKRAKAKA